MKPKPNPGVVERPTNLRLLENFAQEGAPEDCSDNGKPNQREYCTQSNSFSCANTHIPKSQIGNAITNQSSVKVSAQS